MTDTALLAVARKALDALGVALAEHEHVWTPEQRALYEQAMRGAPPPAPE